MLTVVIGVVLPLNMMHGWTIITPHFVAIRWEMIGLFFLILWRSRLEFGGEWASRMRRRRHDDMIITIIPLVILADGLVVIVLMRWCGFARIFKQGREIIKDLFQLFHRGVIGVGA